MENTKLLQFAGIILMLLYPAVSDLKSRQFYLIVPAIIFGFLLIINTYMDIFVEKISAASNLEYWLILLAGGIPGLFFYLTGKISRGQVGDGDAWMVIFTGILSGFGFISVICILALTLTSFAGVGIMLKKRKITNYTLPFLPFFLIAFLIIEACYYCM